MEKNRPDFIGKNLIEFYKTEKNIFGKCPCCGDTFRLSEVKLSYGQPPKDVLAKYRKMQEKFESLQADLDEMNEDNDARVDEVRQELENKLEIARQTFEEKMELKDERWQEKFDNKIELEVKKVEKQIRRDAVDRSLSTRIGHTLERIAPLIKGFGYTPMDVRPMFNPVDFVVFDGLLSDNVKDVVFIEFKTGNSKLSPSQISIREAIDKKRVHFEEVRINTDKLALMKKAKVNYIEKR